MDHARPSFCFIGLKYICVGYSDLHTQVLSRFSASLYDVPIHALLEIGVTLGAAIAALGHMAASQLFGVDPLGRTTYAVVAAVLLIAAAVAAYLPARHASTIRPADVLKAE